MCDLKSMQELLIEMGRAQGLIVEKINGKWNVSKKQKNQTKTNNDFYPIEFEVFWGEYPKRHTSSNKRETYKQWVAREKNGANLNDMINGAKRYAAYCDKTGILGTPYVKDPKSFLGPCQHYMMDWHVEEVKKLLTVPRDFSQLSAFAQKHQLPGAYPGESPQDYSSRLSRAIEENQIYG